MKKLLVALGIGLAAAVSGQAYSQEAPEARDVAQHIADNGFVAGYSKDAFWVSSAVDDEGIVTSYAGVYDFRKTKLYLCESIRMAGDEVLSSCVTDKGLDGTVGACFVGRVPVENALEHVLFRDFDPEYAFSHLTERKMKGDDDAKQSCTRVYARLRSEIVKIEKE